MGGVRYKSYSNTDRNIDGATRWLQAYFHLNVPELAASINWSRPLEIVKRETVIEEDGTLLPEPKELCTIRLFGHDARPVHFTLSATILKSGLLKIGGALEEERLDPNAN